MTKKNNNKQNNEVGKLRDKVIQLIKEIKAERQLIKEMEVEREQFLAELKEAKAELKAQKEMIKELLEQRGSAQQGTPEVSVDPNSPDNKTFVDGTGEGDEVSEETSTESVSDDAQTGESDDEKGDNNNQATSASQSGERQKPQQQQQQQQQRNLKLVDSGRNGANQFSASGEFTEEQLLKMYRQMQADRARTQQLLSHVTSPYNMHGSTGESMAMAAGAFVGFALGRSMYKASRIGHLRQDWRLRREVLRQERGYYNQGTQSRFGGILSGFSNAASSFRQGWQRGTRKDIKMDMQQQAPEKVEVEAAETTESMPTNEPNYGIA